MFLGYININQVINKVHIFILLVVFILSGCSFYPDTVSAEDINVLVLNYHGIKAAPDNRYTVTINDFEKQIKYLYSEGYHSISLDDYKDWLAEGKGLPSRPVLLTFDDGLKDHYEKAMPILKKYGFVGTEFVIVNSIGKSISAEQIKTMIQNGWSVGSHTLNHKKLVWLGREEMRREIAESKSRLEALFNVKVDFFAYPYGYFDDHVESEVKLSGYTGAFTIIPGINNIKKLPFEQRRIMVTRFFSLDIFKKFVSGDKESLIRDYQSEVVQYFRRRLFKPAEIIAKELLDMDKDNKLAKLVLKHIDIARGDSK